jgi:hypothetical protein
MHSTPVESTALRTVTYDAATLQLEVEFRDRSAYLFIGVPAELHEALLRSSSKGEFFNRRIRRCFRFERIHAA